MPILLVALIVVGCATAPSPEPSQGRMEKMGSRAKYVNVKINAESGKVESITGTDERGNPVKPTRDDRNYDEWPLSVPDGENVKRIDSAFWFTGSPFCIRWNKRRI
jgi:hypothetical protein